MRVPRGIGPLAFVLSMIAAAASCAGDFPSAFLAGGSGGSAGEGGSGGTGPCAGDDGCEPGQVCRLECPCKTLPPSCCRGVCRPALPPCPERTRDACASDGGCRWLVPGCGDRPLPEAGCYPAQDCTLAGCPEGLACLTAWVDPCNGFPCMGPACGVRTRVCMPAGPCDLGEPGADGCRGPGGEKLPVTCCAWDCDLSHASCERLVPACPEGDVNTVVGTCYGPCVPPDLCLPGDARARCEATGGSWDEGGCGHTVCGEALAECVRAEPGCHCGRLEVFDDARGCVTSERCYCQSTGGSWDEAACGHWRCGIGNLCDAIIPGCNCGATQTFESGAGCRVDLACFAGEGQRCGGTTGKTCMDGLLCRGGSCVPN